MQQQFFLARQPILDRKENLCAFELLFRSGSKSTEAGVLDVIKLDLMQIAPAQLPALVKEFKKYPIKLLAEKVEDRVQASSCMEMGFDLFQGYYFARPEMLSGKHADASKMVLLRILTLMLSGAENDKIVDAFKEHPTLSYNLLRMVNSASNNLAVKISDDWRTPASVQ